MHFLKVHIITLDLGCVKQVLGKVVSVLINTQRNFAGICNIEWANLGQNFIEFKRLYLVLFTINLKHSDGLKI